ncbi:protease inhibitor I42 family protein [Methyloceanibacter superfactus]|uniref:protease inhibitor I42 family protein n=1 Tax=Methyloceanibacter superfactus TaxID=1774969 RepID=UPI001301041D|nr:protease inhibitor I42 family protein [Methyloceanibacter superfactus]
MRRAATFIALGLIVTASMPADAKTQRNLRLGNSWEFQFEGNPSTGYTWQLDAAASTGLDLIELKSLGYTDGRKKRPGMVGAPAPFKFRITCTKPGYADLWFQYVGPTGKRSPERHEVWVRCD